MKKNIIFKGLTVIYALLIFGTAVSAQDKLVPRCSGRQLFVTETEAEGDMGGKVIGHYKIVNISKRACSLTGYPGFVLLAKGGKTMNVKVTHMSDTPETVNLEPKGAANFTIRYSTGRMGYDKPRRVAHSLFVRIAPPSTGKWFMMKSDIGAFGEVTISSIMAGAPD